MKSFYLSATLVAVALSLFAVAEVSAQRPAAAGAATSAGPAGPIAVIDISYIFKHHRRFQAMMNGMKKDVEAAETQLKKDRETITRKMEGLKDLKPGTPDYNKLEEEITHQQADFNARASLQKKEFLERESKIYMQVYLEVADAVKYHAQQNQISMVLRFNGDPVDPNNRESVLRDINKPIVYNTRGADITPAVLDELNRGTPAPAVPGTAVRPGVPGRTQR